MERLQLSARELDRYSRHIIMDEIGPSGQKALVDGDVLVVGAGGLGSPVIEYLAAAGVGQLTVVDDDVVERSNLQRQVIHRDADIGVPKAESAERFIEDLNPDVTVDAVVDRVTPANVERLIADRDAVVDASDNFETRYLLNDACVLAGIPLFHGAIYRFEGQVTSVIPGEDRPCYRCLFPEAPPAGTVPDCATTGVLGVLPGTVGCIQATEVAKYLMGIGDLLTGRLLFYDALDMTFETIEIRSNPDCPVCGDEPRIESVQDVEYAHRCAIPSD